MRHRDLDHLAHALLPSAQAVLQRQRAMPPMGAVMLHDGEIQTHCSHGHAERSGNAKKVVADFEEEFRHKASGGEVRAVAICMSVTTPAPGRAHRTHAICVAVEHENGEAVDYYLPYRKGWFGRFKFGEVFSQSRRPRIFGSSQGGGASGGTNGGGSLGDTRAGASSATRRR